MSTTAQLPPVTIVIEWENAIDVEDDWTEKAMAGLQRELESIAGRTVAKPRVAYLYNEKAVDPEAIRRVIAKAAPRLAELAELEILATPGLTYYKLKNFGISRSTTEISIMLDSDASPQPGWLEGLLKPFADPEIMAVGGFTVLGYDDLLSKTFALSWIFDLADERDKTVGRHKIHANNCAVRTDFFRANPFPDLPAFKKQCGFWLRDIQRRGIPWVRTAEAMTVHAPQPGVRFLAWRAWTAGLDRDYQAAQTTHPSRLGRLGYAFRFWAKKSSRATRRIISKRREVDLPIWQVPAALCLTWSYWAVVLVAQLVAASSRRYASLPAPAEILQHQ